MKYDSDSFGVITGSEEFYKNVISNLMDLIIVLDLKGNFLYVSPQIFDISGFEQNELIGKNGFKFMHPDDIKKAIDVLRESIEKREKVYIEYRTIHKKGHYIDVAASGRIVNIGGEDRIFAIVQDISEKKRAEQKLKDSENKYKTLSNELEAIFDKIPATIFRKNRKG
ncbi:MAG: PAS domain-containing protein, partial [Candidatus Thorarchaeota archaeon]